MDLVQRGLCDVITTSSIAANQERLKQANLKAGTIPLIALTLTDCKFAKTPDGALPGTFWDTTGV